MSSQIAARRSNHRAVRCANSRYSEGKLSDLRSLSVHRANLFGPADPGKLPYPMNQINEGATYLSFNILTRYFTELGGPVAATVVHVGEENDEDGLLRALENEMEETDEAGELALLNVDEREAATLDDCNMLICIVADEIASVGMDPKLIAELFGNEEAGMSSNPASISGDAAALYSIIC